MMESTRTPAGGQRSSSGDRPAADLLATIVAATRRIVEVRQEREPLAVLSIPARHLAWHPDGKLLTVTSGDGPPVVSLWGTDGKLVRTDPRRVVLTNHLSILVAYGTSASIRKPVPKHYPFPKGY